MPQCLNCNTTIPTPLFGDAIENFCSMVCMHDDMESKGLLIKKEVDPHQSEKDFTQLMGWEFTDEPDLLNTNTFNELMDSLTGKIQS